MTPCPNCKRLHSTDTRTTGDVIACPCGANLIVRHGNGATQLVTLSDFYGYSTEVPTMRVSFERLFNLGNYENEKITLADEVLPGETPYDTYQRLRALAYAMADRTDPKSPKPAPAAPAPSSSNDIPF